MEGFADWPQPGTLFIERRALGCGLRICALDQGSIASNRGEELQAGQSSYLFVTRLPKVEVRGWAIHTWTAISSKVFELDNGIHWSPMHADHTLLPHWTHPCRLAGCNPSSPPFGGLNPPYVSPASPCEMGLIPNSLFSIKWILFFLIG